MEITGAIFDFDGTLFDSMPLWHGVRDRFFNHIGIAMSDEDKELFKGLYLRESLILAKERFGFAETYEELFNQFFDFMKDLYLSGACPKNDIADFLGRLKAKGVKMGIATASGESAIEAALKKYDMLEYFSAIYSTYTVGAAKTDPKVYDTVLNALGTDKRTTWVFEDALYAAKTAKESGYNLVGIYDESEPNTKVLEEISDIYIHNYSEIDV